jgi:acyl-CoA synthetase (NDP forming)
VEAGLYFFYVWYKIKDMEILDFKETEKLLKKYNLEIVKTLFIPLVSKEIKVPKSFQFPLVAKGISKDIFHKVDKGLVNLDIKNEKELGNWFLKIKSQYPNLEGILVQEKAKGIEMFFGLKRDPVFGILLLLGLGGIFVEVLKDIAIGIYPLKNKEIETMIKSLKGYKILEGYRGQEKVDIKSLCIFSQKLLKLMKENAKIKEIDLNPVFVSKNSQIIVDPKFYV